jgi:hypothetical protein
MSHEFILHMVHVAGSRMIEQGMDDLSRGSFLEGVAIGRDMLSFIKLALSATKRHPPILDFVKSWLETASSGVAHVLLERQWFVEGHGIIGGRRTTMECECPCTPPMAGPTSGHRLQS